VLSFISPWYLRAASSDRREILHTDLTTPNFILPVQNFGEPSPTKKLRAKNMQKFGAISDDFKLRRRIFLERIKIFKIGQVSDRPRFLPLSVKKITVNFGPVATEICRSNRKHPLKHLFRKTIFRFLTGAAPPNFCKH